MSTQALAPAKKSLQFSQIPTLQKIEQIVSWLLDKKGEDILALDLAKEAGLAEATVIVSGSSARHSRGLADFLLDECRKQNFEFLRMEGYTSGTWILLDLNDIIVHIFQPESRELYRLDDLWPSATVLADYRKGRI